MLTTINGWMVTITLTGGMNHLLAALRGFSLQVSLYLFLILNDVLIKIIQLMDEIKQQNMTFMI
jgi:hypothetical protein